jgi:hypothetical protein
MLHAGLVGIGSRPEMQTIRFLGAICAFVLVFAVISPARAEAFRVGRLIGFSSPRIGSSLDRRSHCVAYSMFISTIPLRRTNKTCWS